MAPPKREHFDFKAFWQRRAELEKSMDQIAINAGLCPVKVRKELDDFINRKIKEGK